MANQRDSGTAPIERPGAQRIGQIGMVLGVGAIAGAVIGVLGADGGAWSPSAGVNVVTIMVAVAAVAIALSLIGLFVALRSHRGAAAVPALGLIASLVLVGLWLYHRHRDAEAPAIHDVTTDGANPPRFTTLKVEGESSDPQWRTKLGNVDVHPIVIAKPLPVVMLRATQMAEKRGWEMAVTNPAGHIEGTDTVPPFGFKDDIVIDLHAIGEGATTQVEMRSVARDGGSDGGRNAARVKGFLAELQAGL
jgi:hypothetical protein